MKTKPAYYKDIIHSQKRRAEWNNYYGRGTYMITVCKHSACPDFGTLEFSLPENAFIMLSSIGMIIREQVEVTPSFSPEIHIHSYVIMPDHVHILLQVLEPMKHHLGDVIQAIKAASTSRIRKITGNSSLTAFEEGFHDRIITSSKQLEIVGRYLRENARRLAIRKARPEFFRRVNALEIGGKTFQAYGNFQLLDCPFKEQVIVHRADSPETRQKNREQWLYTAANGGVLVSPFISPAEKEIRKEAEEAGGRFILIISEPMGERYKPAGREFELCEAGRLLIISANLPEKLSRKTCLVMNELAEGFAGMEEIG